jgi:predicted ATPase/transcriptional regulator with XRE-family HTH domain
MSTSNTKVTNSSIGELDFPIFFGDWLKRRRKELDLTQTELAQHAYCSVFALRKIEAGERRPSKQLAGMLAKALEIPEGDQTTFIKVARGELNIERLSSVAPVSAAGHSIDTISSPPLINLPFQPTPLIGREAELAALGKLLKEPHCHLLTITGVGGIGKTRLAIELASSQQDLFPGGIYYVPLESLDSPQFIIPAIAEAVGLSISGAVSPQEQLLNHLAALTSQAVLLVLDNLEHLLIHSPGHDEKDDTALLLTNLLQRLPNLKILATSRERSNLQEEWIIDLHGLPVPASDQTNGLEDYSAVALFLQRARQSRADFELLPAERLSLVKVCQLVEGTPLAIELAAAWVAMLSLEEIAQEIASNLDFLTNPMRNVPERHRSLRAVFAHSWKLLSDEERGVLFRLAVFRGGFQRQEAERIAGASLLVLMSLLSKSLLSRRDDNRYDLHSLIRQCALERLHESGHFEEACHKHLAYFVSFALEAQDGLRSAQLAEWLNRIEQEHNNIRAALEWAFTPSAPPEQVKDGIFLLTSIDRFWTARGHIREGITWSERGLRLCAPLCLARAQALRFAGWLYNHIENNRPAIAYLEESLSISRQLNDEMLQAIALDTLADIGWRFGDFDKARKLYAESLELYEKVGDERKIGLSLASSGRLHVDYGHYQEAKVLLTEGLAFLERVSDLRGSGWCYNALARLALFQGEVKLAGSQFKRALRINNELGYMIDIADGLRSLSVINSIEGDVSRATLLLAAATKIQKRIGFTYEAENDPMHQHAPSTWLQTDTSSQVWKQGEMMPLDQVVAYALGSEME